jgi:uroporphyrinogen decarboxylase
MEDLQWLRKQAENEEQILARMDYLWETLSRVKPQLAPHQTLIGFCGAPWTVASYMIEGGSAHGEFFESKMLMLQKPDVFLGLMEILTRLSIRYLEKQVEAGAEILQVFESWGGALTPHQYAHFCAPFTTKLIEALRPRVPCIHFVGESAGLLDSVLAVPSDVFGVDWRQDIANVSQHPAAAGKALQGNLDPLLLYAPFDALESRVISTLQAGLAHKGGYIFNLGHGIRQTTPVEAVGFVVDVVHSYRS